MGIYRLVNPHISGSFDSMTSSNDSINAANELWTRLSDHITGNLPNFTFSLQEQSGGKLHHFKVIETLAGKYADYTITGVDVKLTDTQVKNLNKKTQELDKMNESIQSGGASTKKRYKKEKYEKSNVYPNSDDSSSSSSDSDDSIYEKIKQLHRQTTPKPIVYWWYSPTLYNLRNFYVPTFVAPYTPYMKFDLNNFQTTYY